MFTLRPLLALRLRLALTVGGIALCIVLMLFLQAVYTGVREGSIEYVASSDADLWVLQRNQTNVLRGTSLLPMASGQTIRQIEGVASAAPVLFLMAAVQVPGGTATLYLTGFDPGAGRGGPPGLVDGRAPERDDEIVLDASFAAKHGFRVGHTVRLGDDALCVVGISRGTNMCVIQYAFTTLRRAQAIAGRSRVVSAWLVEVEDSAVGLDVERRIEKALGVTAFDGPTFVANNVREMEAGFLPLLYTIAVLGAVVLTAILSLILSVEVVERREDYAVMKAIGAPEGAIPALVLRQALVLASAGLAVAVAALFPLVALVHHVAPEVSARPSAVQIVGTGLGALGIGLVSSILPIQRLRRVYALEVFR